MNNFSYSKVPFLSSSMKGFTLIEVMVAVAILALALPAMMYALSNQLDNTAYLRDKMFAQWAAENALAEIRLENRSSGRIKAKKLKGEEEIAGRTWYWRSEAKAFPQEEFKDIYGVQVAVYSEKNAKDEASIFRMTGMIRQYDQAAIKRPDFEAPPGD